MRSNTFGFLLIVGLALVAVLAIFQWQSGGVIAMPSFGSDSRMVVKLGSKTTKFKNSDLQVGDTILSIQGIEVHSSAETYKVLEALYQPGLETLTVSVRRTNDDGKSEVKTVDLARERIKSLRLKGGGKANTTIRPTPEALVAAANAGNATAVGQILDTTEGRALIDKQVEGQTALMAAVSKGNMEVVRVLLDHGANPNATSADQTTPLIRAAELNNADLVAALMVAGADPGIRNSQLQTASDVAESMGFGDVSDFIDDPSPTRFLTADQKRKIADPLRNMGVLKQSGYRPTDAELSDAIRAYQAQAGLPVSGIVTAETYGDLVKYSARALGTKNDQQLSANTKVTLARLFARPLQEDWTPVNSTSGYPRCEEESVRFEISADQKVITWKSYRPGVTEEEITAGAKPTQQAAFKVQWANQIEGYDSIMVQPDPKPMVGPTFQLWEIRDGTMRITQQDKKGNGQSEPPAEGDASDTPAADFAGTGDSGVALNTGGRASFLATCRS